MADEPPKSPATATSQPDPPAVAATASSDAPAPVPAPAPTIAADPAPLESDPTADNDADSAFDAESLGSRTTSLASSIAKYRLENGRTYHSYKEGSYILPNDEIENERLDLQHHIMMMTIDGKLHLAPVGRDKPVGRVLDAGCGTGIWSMDFADEHPEAEVIGIDLSPIQPSFIPPNVSFYVDDLEEPWAYNTPFDFIYLRMMTASIRDWPKLFRQAYDNLNPGGYIELYDPIYPMDCDDGTLKPDSALMKWSTLMNEAGKKLGSSLDTILNYKEQLIEAGFTNVVVSKYKWPMNTWPKDPKYKELGAWTLENILRGIQALSLALFTRALGWEKDDLELFLVQVRKELKDRDIHGYWHIHVVYAQKPE